VSGEDGQASLKLDSNYNILDLFLYREEVLCCKRKYLILLDNTP
jgi:hypothetical protein